MSCCNLSLLTFCSIIWCKETETGEAGEAGEDGDGGDGEDGGDGGKDL